KPPPRGGRSVLGPPHTREGGADLHRARNGGRMTAIPIDDPPDTPSAGSERARTVDAIRREMVSLRARVRTLAEQRAETEADRLTQELRAATEEAARAIRAACEHRAVLLRVRNRLARRVNADLILARGDDEPSVDVRARVLLVARLDLMLDTSASNARDASSVAHADPTPGSVRALRILEEHRELVRARFRSLKSRLQSELADLSLDMAGETAARLCLRYGRQGQEWLWWRLSKIVDQFVAVSKPASLPAHLELLATRSVLSGLEKHRESRPPSRPGAMRGVAAERKAR